MISLIFTFFLFRDRGTNFEMEKELKLLSHSIALDVYCNNFENMVSGATSLKILKGLCCRGDRRIFPSSVEVTFLINLIYKTVVFHLILKLLNIFFHRADNKQQSFFHFIFNIGK